MTNDVIALIALIVALIGSIVGAFAYLMGELRRVGNSAREDNEQLQSQLMTRLDGVSKIESEQRNLLRSELNNAISRVQYEVRNMGERFVRREDVSEIEKRLVRTVERLESKIDALQNKATQLLVGRNLTGSDRG